MAAITNIIIPQEWKTQAQHKWIIIHRCNFGHESHWEIYGQTLLDYHESDITDLTCTILPLAKRRECDVSKPYKFRASVSTWSQLFIEIDVVLE